MKSDASPAQGNSKFENDLTGGSVSRQLIRFSLPFLLSNFIQAMYNVADVLVVSWFAGPNAVSGVANGGQVTLLVTNSVIGLALGGTVLIGQYFGAKQREDVQKTMGTLLSVLGIASVVLTIVMIALCEPLLRLIRIPEESFTHAKYYLNICMSGTFFIFGYNAISAILRGMGDSKNPLFFVAIACAANVGLDFLLVGAFHMGAAGAALATVIAQALSLALSVIYLKKSGFMFAFTLKSFRIDREKLKLLIKVGLPTSCQNMVVGLSFMLMMVMVNGYGVYASAAMGIVGKFNSFAILPAIAMSASVSSMAAQNIGAGLPDRAKQAMFCGIRIVLPISGAFFLAAFIAPAAIMRIFTDSPEVVEQGIEYIRFFSIDYLVVPFGFCVNGLLTGAGRTTFTMINAMMSSILLRMPIAFVFGIVLGFGLAGIGLAAPVASLGGLAISLLYMHKGNWKESRIK